VKFEPNEPPFLGLPKNFDSVLPPSAVTNGAISPLFAMLGQSDLGALVVENTSTIAAQLGREVATSIGWPDTQIDELGGLVATAFDRIPAPEIAKVIASAAAQIPDALVDIQRAWTDTISGVPLLGWIVKLGLLVWDIVEVARTRAPKIASQVALGYDRDGDSFVTNQLMVRTQGADWTDLFLPPAGGFDVIDLAYTSSGLADGIAWGQVSGSGTISAERVGLLPGVGQIGGYWQTPRKLVGSSRDAGVESIVTGNRLYPSTTSFAALLWSASQRPGAPTVGAVDLAKVVDAWNEYGAQLEAFAASQSEWRRAQIRGGWRWFDEYTGAPYYGFKRDKAPAKFRDVWGLQGLIAWRVEVAREQIRKSLSTLSCAYMGPNTPALRDAGLRERWQLMRSKLLHHEARADVDLELVPDAEYRSALYAARQSIAGGFTIGEPPKPDKPPRMPVPTVDGSPTPPEPEPPALPDPPGWTPPADTDGPGGGIAIAVLAALVFLRRRR
jgi:MYXO-CTERM domain-containing protein